MKINKLHEKVQVHESKKQLRRRLRDELNEKSLFKYDIPFDCVVCDKNSNIMMYCNVLACSWECFCLEFKRMVQEREDERQRYKEDANHKEVDPGYYRPEDIDSNSDISWQ